MKKSPSPTIHARKEPLQARSKELVADILEAAIRVLVREGGARFTTVRVADEAGVSVGSLYQYFPTREALLFRLQADEWNDTWSLIEEILEDARLAPPERLRKAVVTFFRSEQEEASLRRALDDTGAPFREAPEAEELLSRGNRSLTSFFALALPHVPAKEREFTARFLMTSMGAVAEDVTHEPLSRAEVDAWGEASAEMYVAYLDRLDERYAGR